MDLPPAYTPQAIADILPIYRPQNADNHINTYKLHQTGPTTQVLTLQPSPPSTDPTTSYTIKTRATGGFMNRKPHVLISTTPSNPTSSSSSPDTLIAEARYDNLGTGTTITYPSSPSANTQVQNQTLALESSWLQCLKTSISGLPAWWQPHPGNKGVLELTNDTEEIIARFIYNNDAIPSRRNSSIASLSPGPEKKTKKFTESEVGELSLVTELVGGGVDADGEGEGVMEVVCSCVVVVERAKRRSEYMCRAAAGKGGVSMAAGGF